MSRIRPRSIRRRNGPQPVVHPPEGAQQQSLPPANPTQGPMTPLQTISLPPNRTHFRIIQPHGNGWEYPAAMISKPISSIKIVLIRGVRLFSLRYEFNRVHSYVPFTKYAVVLYQPSNINENFSNQFNRYKYFKWIAGFLRVSNGEFLPRSRWNSINFASEDELVAVYRRDDGLEGRLIGCAVVDLPADIDAGKYDIFIPERDEGIEARFRKIFRIKYQHPNGPAPLYLNELERLDILNNDIGYALPPQTNNAPPPAGNGAGEEYAYAGVQFVVPYRQTQLKKAMKSIKGMMFIGLLIVLFVCSATLLAILIIYNWPGERGPHPHGQRYLGD